MSKGENNQNPEQVARDTIDEQLRAAGWAVQGKNDRDSNECQGQAVREYQTDTATPDSRTYAFFNQNVVSEYTHEDAVADGVNVQGEIYLIETEVTQKGGKVLKGKVEKRENSPANSSGNNRIKTKPTPPKNSTATSSTNPGSTKSSRPSATAYPTSSPTAMTKTATTKSPRPSSSPRPTPTPTTSSPPAPM